MSPDAPSRSLVIGVEAAARLHIAMDQRAAAFVPEPRWQGGRCWSLHADVPTPVSPSIVAALGTAEAALLVSPDGTGGWHYHLKDGDRLVEGAVAAHAGISSSTELALQDWCARHRPSKKPPPFIRRATRERPWVPDLLEDDTAALLRNVGWPLHQGLPDRAMLPGALHLEGPAMLAGEINIPNSVTTFCGGFTQDHYALWDRRRPVHPVQVWEKEPGNRNLMMTRLQELVVDPIIDSTTQHGPRMWAAAVPKYSEMSPVAGLLVHWTPDGRMSVVVPAERPATAMLSRAGHATLHGPAANAFLQAEGLDSIDVPLKDFDTVLAVARAYSCMFHVGPWQDVPADAGTSLRSTCASILRSAATEAEAAVAGRQRRSPRSPAADEG